MRLAHKPGLAAFPKTGFLLICCAVGLARAQTAGPKDTYLAKVPLPRFRQCRVSPAGLDPAIKRYKYGCTLMSGPRLTQNMREAYRSLVERVQLITGSAPKPVRSFFQTETFPGSGVFDQGSVVSFDTPQDTYAMVDLSGSFNGWSVELRVYGPDPTLR
jgi:hypothetical protein